MNSKKFLRRLHNNLGCEDCKNNKCKNNREILRECDQWYETIYEDLDRLEKLEKENQELKEQNINLREENDKFKKAIEILKGFKIDLIDYSNGH